MFRSATKLLLATSLPAVVLGGVTRRDGVRPALPFDEATTSDCTWWEDLRTSITCTKLLSDNLITKEQFLRWVSSNSQASQWTSDADAYRTRPSTQPVTIW
jgi:hypothetical protein